MRSEHFITQEFRLHTRLLIVAASVAAAAGAGSIAAARPAPVMFTLTSPTIMEGGTMGMDHVFNSFGCTGKNISPALSWSGAPEGTRSFAITVYDPDAPTGSGWWHWTVANIPASVTSLAAGAGSTTSALPKGAVEGRTDFGKPGYGGPCPPKGDKPHRYVFTVFALKVERLALSGEASGAMFGYNLYGNMLAKASLTALLGR